MVSPGGLKQELGRSSEKHAARWNQNERTVSGVPGNQRPVVIQRNRSHPFWNGQMSVGSAKIRAAVAVTSNVSVALKLGFSVKRRVRTAIKADF